MAMIRFLESRLDAPIAAESLRSRIRLIVFFGIDAAKLKRFFRI
jgi:hypothetical protein